MARGTFGERLHREREMREVSIEEITKATRIAPRYLQALENEDWARLPGGIFARGFVRTIAHYLGLNEEDLLAEYDLARGEQGSGQAAPAEESGIPRPPVWPFAFGALLILSLLVVAGVYGWRYYAAHRARQAPTLQAPAPDGGIVSAAPPPAPNPSPSPASADSGQAAPLHLLLSTSAATHVRVTGDGGLLLDREMQAGENRHFRAKKRFEVTASDSGAVLLELNGQAMPPIGAPRTFGTIVLGPKDLKQAAGGTRQP